MRRLLLIGCLVLAPSAAIAANPFTSLHPEEAIPDPARPVSAGRHDDFIKRVQARLRELGFAAGPVNGDFGEKTQAALAQFQLSRTIPASGQLDDQTLAELGVTRDEPEASAGPSAPAPQPAGASAGSSPSIISPERTAEPKPVGQGAEPGSVEKKPAN
jgi:peptidoglycan hydrolase-like protein with peptidoglycan-binding domain